MHRCPECGCTETHVVQGRKNRCRMIVSLLVAPIYLLGGAAGTDRGPILPLERRCPRCGSRFMYRSFLDDLLGRRRSVRLLAEEEEEDAGPTT